MDIDPIMAKSTTTVDVIDMLSPDHKPGPAADGQTPGLSVLSEPPEALSGRRSTTEAKSGSKSRKGRRKTQEPAEAAGPSDDRLGQRLLEAWEHFQEHAEEYLQFYE